MPKYKQRKDGEGFEVPSGEIYRIACCDCGLVHDFLFVSEDGEPIGVAARRNRRATAQRRARATSKELSEAEIQMLLRKGRREDGCYTRAGLVNAIKAAFALGGKQHGMR